MEEKKVILEVKNLKKYFPAGSVSGLALREHWR